MQVIDTSQISALAPPAPVVRYSRDDVHTILAAPDTLAVFGFGCHATSRHDPRHICVPLASLPIMTGTHAPTIIESWSIDASVQHGRADDLTWSTGSGWLLVSVHVDETEFGGLHNATAYAYRRLVNFLGKRAEKHVQRVWNYLDAINDGHGDAERYKRFCAGRAEGMGDFFADGFPAATAIGHRRGDGLLQVYALASIERGSRIENPRQLSAWHYPPQHGSTPPRFARAMRMPANDALAISGTAAIVGHQSQHDDDLHAQLDETLNNMQSLFDGDDRGFDTEGVLKVYIRHAQDAAAVDAVLAERAPRMSRLLLLGDICRRELLVEIDGWRYATRSG